MQYEACSTNRKGGKEVTKVNSTEKTPRVAIKVGPTAIASALSCASGSALALPRILSAANVSLSSVAELGGGRGSIGAHTLLRILHAGVGRVVWNKRPGIGVPPGPRWPFNHFFCNKSFKSYT